MGGSPLNRLSWLRTSTPFLRAVLASPATRWLLFNGGQPLVHVVQSPPKRTLGTLSTDEIKLLIGSEPIFEQGQQTRDASTADEGTPVIPALEAARLHGPRIVFLGLHEPTTTTLQSALPSSEFSAKTEPAVLASNIHGTPYFAIDVSSSAEGVEEVLKISSAKLQEGASLQFVEARSASSAFDSFEAAVFAEARALIDWNTRYKVAKTILLLEYSS